MDRPDWWTWELAYTEHAEQRMEERGISDVELRAMLDASTCVEPASRVGRWAVRTRHGNRPGAVVLEPDADERLLFLVTMYPIRR